MNDSDLSDLSYKELQALAHTYRVPGNIKKHLLVRTLQAIQSGNELEVDRMLTEVQQTRKKRVKKQKLGIMNVITSTPIRSPNYTIPDDSYYTRHQPPYQWVGAEEEIAVREDDATRIPNYMEFQQFLLRRIQRDQYEAYGRTGDIESVQGPSIVDLRMGAGSSVLRPINVDANYARSSVTFDPNSYARPSSDVELQILDDRGDNNQANKPELLKKLLEAPVGANLGKIASPDTGSQRFWPLDQYPSFNGNHNHVDDSDTLTADSENDNEDAWDDNNNGVNVNNPMNYYYPVNDSRNEAYQPDVQPSRNAEIVGEPRDNLPCEGMQQYPFGYHASDIQSNCEKWIAANNFVNRDATYAEQFIENSRAYNAVYYGSNCGNSALTRSINRDRKCQYYNETNETIHYETNTIIHGQRYNWANEPHSYTYQGNNAIVESSTIDPNEMYYSQQQMTRQPQPMAEEHREYFAGCNDVESLNPAQFVGNICDKNPPVSFHHHDNNNSNINNNNNSINNNNNNHGMQYDSGYYQYSQENVFAAGYAGTINANEQEEGSGVAQTTANGRKNLVETTTTTSQPISNGVLDPYWPRWPMNPAETSNGRLETILNLENRSNGSLDRSKSNETSSVYCYTGPIVTQRIESGHATWCTRNKPPIAETRQHIFTSNVLLYNDASTGMIMANASDPSSVDRGEPPVDASKDETTVNSSVEREYELRVSDNSSDGTINDVWIHDYENYPVSSDNALQSVDLTNDENDDDLFSTVRDASRNSIDDHTIETFTDIHY